MTGSAVAVKEAGAPGVDPRWNRHRAWVGLFAFFAAVAGPAMALGLLDWGVLRSAGLRVAGAAPPGFRARTGGSFVRDVPKPL